MKNIILIGMPGSGKSTIGVVLAKKMATKMSEKLQCDGLNIVQNNGEAAGQTVKHFHMHLIPRYENDGQHILWNPGESTPEELEEIRKTITE